MQGLHAMQRARIIHTDIKPDNCLLSWPPQLQASTGAPWTAAAAERPGSEFAGGCIQVIDFGRAIDLELLPVGTQFVGASTTEGMQCPEMLEGKPWHFCVRTPPPPWHRALATPAVLRHLPCAGSCEPGSHGGGVRTSCSAEKR